jgi:hypothetical integral membrane protein (TIGR02206 family)
MDEPFQLFGPAHLLIICLTFLLPALLVAATRLLCSNFFINMVLFTLASVLVANRIWAVSIVWDAGVRRWADFLPLHLCDVATFMVVIACFTRHAGLIRITYFFALAGTLQAILTPDIRVNFPEPRFISFFVSHCGIVISALYLTFGLKIYPRWQNIIHAFLWLQIYALTAFATNFLFGTNFGYLARKPANPSMLDFFGPWPWYILVLEVLAVVKFTLLFAPFYFLKLLHRTKLQKA